MTDHPQEHGEGVKPRIDLQNDQDVNYWTRKLTISREELVDAVELVGDLADDVERHIRQEQAPGANPPSTVQSVGTRAAR